MNKITLFIFVFFTYSAIGQNTNQTKVTSLNGKSIDFYLNNSQIDKYSKLYYNGQLAASFDSITFSLIDSLLTRNNQTRPFYLFVFNQIMKISDGALSEYISGHCLKYLETYPCDFFNAIHYNEYFIDSKKWSLFVGFEIHTSQLYNEFVLRLDSILKTNCKNNMNSWSIFKIELKKNLQE